MLVCRFTVKFSHYSQLKHFVSKATGIFNFKSRDIDFPGVSFLNVSHFCNFFSNCSEIWILVQILLKISSAKFHKILCPQRPITDIPKPSHFFGPPDMFSCRYSPRLIWFLPKSVSWPCMKWSGGMLSFIANRYFLQY